MPLSPNLNLSVYLLLSGLLTVQVPDLRIAGGEGALALPADEAVLGAQLQAAGLACRLLEPRLLLPLLGLFRSAQNECYAKKTYMQITSPTSCVRCSGIVI